MTQGFWQDGWSVPEEKIPRFFSGHEDGRGKKQTYEDKTKQKGSSKQGMERLWHSSKLCRVLPHSSLPSSVLLAWVVLLGWSCVFGCCFFLMDPLPIMKTNMMSGVTFLVACRTGSLDPIYFKCCGSLLGRQDRWFLTRKLVCPCAEDSQAFLYPVEVTCKPIFFVLKGIKCFLLKKKQQLISHP